MGCHAAIEHAARAILSTQSLAELIFQTSREPMVLLDLNLRVKIANRGDLLSGLILRVMKDVTQLREAQETAARHGSDAELDQFSCAASHGLEEPLRMVAGFSQSPQGKRRFLSGLVHSIEILLVEGTAFDLRLIRELLADSKVENRVNSVPDEVEALKYLRRDKPYKDAAQPDLILLGLNLRRKNGQVVLSEIRKNRALRHIPVAMVTS
jgi:CheY-like chemotaxis protein